MTEKDIYWEYKYHRWWFPMRYFRYRQYLEVTRQATCSICLETENYYDCVICRVCKDGTICCECFDAYELTLYDYSIGDYLIPPCPLCRTLFISNKIKDLIQEALANRSVIPTPNNLYRRWIYNHMISDEYQFGRFDVEACFIHREYQLKVTRDIKRIKVNKDIKTQIKKYNVKMATKDLKYKLHCEECEKSYIKIEKNEKPEQQNKPQKEYNPEMDSLFIKELCNYDF
jgi:hypothetical protein